MRVVNPWKQGKVLEHSKGGDFQDDTANRQALSRWQFMCDCPCGCIKVDYSDSDSGPPGWTALPSNMHQCSHCRFHSSAYPMR